MGFVRGCGGVLLCGFGCVCGLGFYNVGCEYWLFWCGVIELMVCVVVGCMMLLL